MAEDRFQRYEDTQQEQTELLQDVKDRVSNLEEGQNELKTEVKGLKDRIDDLAENQAFFLEQMNQMEVRILRHFAMAQEAWQHDMKAFREGCLANNEQIDDHETRLSRLEDRAS